MQEHHIKNRNPHKDYSSYPFSVSSIYDPLVLSSRKGTHNPCVPLTVLHTATLFLILTVLSPLVVGASAVDFQSNYRLAPLILDSANESLSRSMMDCPPINVVCDCECPYPTPSFTSTPVLSQSRSPSPSSSSPSRTSSGSTTSSLTTTSTRTPSPTLIPLVNTTCNLCAAISSISQVALYTVDSVSCTSQSLISGGNVVTRAASNGSCFIITDPYSQYNALSSPKYVSTVQQDLNNLIAQSRLCPCDRTFSQGTYNGTLIVDEGVTCFTGDVTIDTSMWLNVARKNPSILVRVYGDLRFTNGTNVYINDPAAIGNVFFVVGKALSVQKGSLLLGTYIVGDGISIQDNVNLYGRLINRGLFVQIPGSVQITAPQCLNNNRTYASATSSFSVMPNPQSFTATSSPSYRSYPRLDYGSLGMISLFSKGLLNCTGFISINGGSAALQEGSTQQCIVPSLGFRIYNGTRDSSFIRTIERDLATLISQILNLQISTTINQDLNISQDNPFIFNQGVYEINGDVHIQDNLLLEVSATNPLLVIIIYGDLTIHSNTNTGISNNLAYRNVHWLVSKSIVLQQNSLVIGNFYGLVGNRIDDDVSILGSFFARGVDNLVTGAVTIVDQDIFGQNGTASATSVASPSISSTLNPVPTPTATNPSSLSPSASCIFGRQIVQSQWIYSGGQTDLITTFAQMADLLQLTSNQSEPIDGLLAYQIYDNATNVLEIYASMFNESLNCVFVKVSQTPLVFRSLQTQSCFIKPRYNDTISFPVRIEGAQSNSLAQVDYIREGTCGSASSTSSFSISSTATQTLTQSISVSNTQTATQSSSGSQSLTLTRSPSATPSSSPSPPIFNCSQVANYTIRSSDFVFLNYSFPSSTVSTVIVVANGTVILQDNQLGSVNLAGIANTVNCVAFYRNDTQQYEFVQSDNCMAIYQYGQVGIMLPYSARIPNSEATAQIQFCGSLLNSSLSNTPSISSTGSSSVSSTSTNSRTSSPTSTVTPTSTATSTSTSTSSSSISSSTSPTRSSTPSASMSPVNNVTCNIVAQYFVMPSETQNLDSGFNISQIDAIMVYSSSSKVPNAIRILDDQNTTRTFVTEGTQGGLYCVGIYNTSSQRFMFRNSDTCTILGQTPDTKLFREATVPISSSTIVIQYCGNSQTNTPTLSSTNTATATPTPTSSPSPSPSSSSIGNCSFNSTLCSQISYQACLPQNQVFPIAPLEGPAPPTINFLGRSSLGKQLRIDYTDSQTGVTYLLGSVTNQATSEMTLNCTLVYNSANSTYSLILDPSKCGSVSMASLNYPSELMLTSDTSGQGQVTFCADDGPANQTLLMNRTLHAGETMFLNESRNFNIQTVRVISESAEGFVRFVEPTAALRKRDTSSLTLLKGAIPVASMGWTSWFKTSEVDTGIDCTSNRITIGNKNWHIFSNSSRCQVFGTSPAVSLEGEMSSNRSLPVQILLYGFVNNTTPSKNDTIVIRPNTLWNMSSYLQTTLLMSVTNSPTSGLITVTYGQGAFIIQDVTGDISTLGCTLVFDNLGNLTIANSSTCKVFVQGLLAPANFLTISSNYSTSVTLTFMNTNSNSASPSISLTASTSVSLSSSISVSATSSVSSSASLTPSASFSSSPTGSVSATATVSISASSTPTASTTASTTSTVSTTPSASISTTSSPSYTRSASSTASVSNTISNSASASVSRSGSSTTTTSLSASISTTQSWTPSPTPISGAAAIISQYCQADTVVSVTVQSTPQTLTWTSLASSQIVMLYRISAITNAVFSNPSATLGFLSLSPLQSVCVLTGIPITSSVSCLYSGSVNSLWNSGNVTVNGFQGVYTTCTANPTLQSADFIREDNVLTVSGPLKPTLRCENFDAYHPLTWTSNPQTSTMTLVQQQEDLYTKEGSVRIYTSTGVYTITSQTWLQCTFAVQGSRLNAVPTNRCNVTYQKRHTNIQNPMQMKLYTNIIGGITQCS